ncbi:OmpA family protein [Solimonas terrae]|uniref:OmpA family protein n=1 Tax=Solimonas terrae TaxID=1396819 RepID=A0A6M2BVT3_9GAMM|nr:OmpA family protein [Solimonas terrae]NGY06243.1 OmpA family protein [Solimonas terrae]
MRTRALAGNLALALTAFALAGCQHYVKQEDYDATIAQLRANDASLRSDLDSLKSQLDSRFSAYDAKISQLQGRVRVDLAAHFDYGKAALRDQDKPALDDFASVIHQHPDTIVTVEGFTDPAGTVAYNKKLGQERADAVRAYLIQNGGLAANQIRAVSYGEAKNRQIEPGAYGDAGQDNRRVALVIDHVPAASTAGAG